MKNTSITKSFTVSKVFRHRDKNCPQYHNGIFREIVEEAAGRVIPISKAPEKLSEYVLPTKMNDSEIQKATKSTPMEEDEFFATLYLLIIEPELGKEYLRYELKKGKWYVFHVRLKSGIVIPVGARWRSGYAEWYMCADEFGVAAWWHKGSIFVYPAAVA